ncbi:MAG: ABC transporter ATP-binding protein [Candidatus Thermoplasmatota archaeon]
MGIRKRFGPRWILRDVSLDVGEGECVALLGPNGAGKTTLLRIAATVSRPDGGNIEVCGVDARKHPERARSFLSFLPQTAPLYAELTAREHLGWWGRMHDVAVGKDLVDAALVDAGLLKHARSRATALSRGQRQRLSLAMAFLPSPRLLLLDEPFAALDVEGRAWVEQRLMARRGLGATLVASHEPETIMRIAHRALRVADARVEAMA